jgi:hypothetical protein
MRRSFKTLAIAITTVGAVLQMSHTYAGTIVFDNFLPGDTFSGGGFGIDSQTEYAGSFVPHISGFLSDMLIAVTLAPIENLPNDVTVRIRADDNGMPGTSLESFHFLDALGDANFGAPLDVSASGTTLLQAGQRYWVTVAPMDGTQALWHIGIDPDPNPRPAASQVDAQPWFVFMFNNTQAFRVEVNAVMEPASSWLLMTALAFLSVCFRRAGLVPRPRC